MVLLATSATAQAAISWDGGGSSMWWFDPANWSRQTDPGGPFLPPSQGQPVFATDAQINGVGGAPQTMGAEVVYDPANDPFFDAADDLAYPTGSVLTTSPSVMRDYGPQTIYRLYISRNTTNANVLRILSGDLAIESTTIIGRSGSTAEAQNLGMVIQEGGSLRLPLENLDLGNRETSGWGNGTYDYHGGILEVALEGDVGIRLSAGGSAGTGGVGKFIMRNPATGGRVRTFDFEVSSHGGNGDGMTTGVGIVELHFENGGVQPIQLQRNLVINNGLDDDMAGVHSARLDLKLDAAPSLTGGVPQNLGLFDVNFGDVFAGIITGSGDLGNVFSNVDASDTYEEGDTVSAVFGSTRYDWTITYTGNITWTDADNSVVDAITGPGTGSDVVLIGSGSETIAVDNADFDGDGDVDGADFLTWQRNLGMSAGQTGGDANNSGTVGAADLGIWQEQFSAAAATATIATVPEPGVAGLLLAALLASLPAARKRAH
ncbi:MAG TPA: hypothetical protein VF175_14910 [Lacipirellula sp.]